MFRTPYNFDAAEAVCFEPVNDEPEVTVPDMSLTVREILERFTSNTLPPIAKNGYYDENPSFDDELSPDRIPDFDLADASIALADLESRKVQRKNELRDQEQSKKEPSQTKKVDDGQTDDVNDKVDGKSADA